MLDATRDAVLIFDGETFRFIYANQGAADQVGYSVDELLTMTMLHINPEFDEPRLRELLAPLERGEQTSVMFASTHRHRDGHDIPVEIILQATEIEDGRPRAFIKIVRDIGARLADEARLREVEQGLRTMEDRDRIARDLHDVVIQRLFAVGLSIQALQALSPDAEIDRRLGVAVNELDETIREIRTVIFSLQSVSPGHRSGLRTEIMRVIDEQKASLGFQPRVQFDGVIDVVSQEIAEQLLPTLREALSNIARHAHATSVLVRITAGDRVTLHVDDDGIGIPADPVYGNGITNLDRRARDLGGTFEIASNADGGTTLEWSVPAHPDTR
jgi:PAS domain S-box-containing protein